MFFDEVIYKLPSPLGCFVMRGNWSRHSATRVGNGIMIPIGRRAGIGVGVKGWGISKISPLLDPKVAETNELPSVCTVVLEKAET
jgi:hypothetical protein